MKPIKPGKPATSIGKPMQAQGLPHSLSTAIEQGNLAARVESLEKALSELQATAVLQTPDGKLHLPAGSTFRIDFGNTRFTMDFSTVTIEANGRKLLDGSPTRTAGSSPAPAGPSIQGIAGQTSPGNWQSVAQQNAVDDPRRLSTGTVLRPR